MNDVSNPQWSHLHDFQDGWSPLMAASRIGHLEIVGKLLAAGAQPDVHMKVCGVLHMMDLLSNQTCFLLPSQNGLTALMAASYCGHNNVVELLLKENTSINLQQKVCVHNMEKQIVSDL